MDTVTATQRCAACGGSAAEAGEIEHHRDGCLGVILVDFRAGQARAHAMGANSWRLFRGDTPVPVGSILLDGEEVIVRVAEPTHASVTCRNLTQAVRAADLLFSGHGPEAALAESLPS